MAKITTEIADYSEVIRLRPDDCLAYFDRGNAYAEKSDTDKANADFAKAGELKHHVEGRGEANNEKHQTSQRMEQGD